MTHICVKISGCAKLFREWVFLHVKNLRSRSFTFLSSLKLPTKYGRTHFSKVNLYEVVSHEMAIFERDESCNDKRRFIDDQKLFSVVGDNQEERAIPKP